MSIDLILLILIGALTLLLLQLKSHIKFVALGLFLGIVLAHFTAREILDFLSGYLPLGPEGLALSILQLALVILPAVILGFNHYHTRTHAGLIKPLVLALLTSLLAVSSILEFMPGDTRRLIILNSFVAGQLSFLSLPILITTAIAVMADRHHLAYPGKRHRK